MVQALREWVAFGTYEFQTPNITLINGKYRTEPIHIDDETNPKRRATLSENQRYWTNRWSDQMNYRYWKDRAMAEMTDPGVQARQLFYEGTIAYKSGDPGKAAQKFKEGLEIWDKLLKEHLDYRNDEFNKKDTGLVVRRYLKALRQLGEAEPKDVPLRELVVGDDSTVNLDPFDATEMMDFSRIQPSGAGKAPASK